ncbi:MAG: DUF6968 family protein [Geminicoccaceae bacterium]
MASREVTAGNDRILVTIGKPELFDPDGMEGFCCSFSVEPRGRKEYRYTGAADAVQALQLVTYMIGVDLEHLARSQRLSISREGIEGTGFPQSMPSKADVPVSRLRRCTSCIAHRL